ncbi:MAG: hypothetical protein ACM3IH_01065 [Sphingobacteriales bacterium]|jgi:hypothetical protein
MIKSRPRYIVEQEIDAGLEASPSQDRAASAQLSKNGYSRAAL